VTVTKNNTSDVLLQFSQIELLNHNSSEPSSCQITQRFWDINHHKKSSDNSKKLQNEVPSWIKNNADWWAQGLVTNIIFYKK
jgi:hypothetical protein